MKSTTESNATTSSTAGAEGEHPFRGLNDRWRPIARSNRRDTKVETRLEIVLDPEQSAWVLQQAKRAGLDFETYVKSLIDAARRQAIAP